MKNCDEFVCFLCKKEVDKICELGPFHPLRPMFPNGYCEDCFTRVFHEDSLLLEELYNTQLIEENRLC